MVHCKVLSLMLSQKTIYFKNQQQNNLGALWLHFGPLQLQCSTYANDKGNYAIIKRNVYSNILNNVILIMYYNFDNHG